MDTILLQEGAQEIKEGRKETHMGMGGKEVQGFQIVPKSIERNN